MRELDLLDRKLMYELDLDSRRSVPQLARRLRKSKETVNFRLKRLLSDGCLNGFYTVFNASKLGWYYFKVFLKLCDIDPKQEEKMLLALSKADRVSYLASTDGYYDCVILIMVRGAEQMESFMRDFMSQYGHYVLEKRIMLRLTAHRTNMRFLYAGGEERDWSYPVKLGAYAVDAIDLRLIRSIAENARAPIVEIARKSGVGPKTAAFRLRRLERDKVILAYVSSPNPDRLGLQFVQVNISLKDHAMKKPMLGFFKSTDTCLFAMETLGGFDFGVELYVSSSEQLKLILNRFRSRFAGQYNFFDVATITKEYRAMKGPFGSDIAALP